MSPTAPTARSSTADAPAGARPPSLARRGLLALVAVAALVGLQVAATEALDPYLQRILAVCGTNVMLAVALNLVNGTTGQFSIGHAGFMAVGAYAAAYVSSHLSGALGAGFVGGSVALLASLAAGAVAAGAAGVLVGGPSLRLRGDYLAIVTLGFGEIIRITIESTPALGGSLGYPLGAQSLEPYATMGWIWGGALVSVLLVWNLTYSTHGRALAAIREDEIAAEAAGIPTTRYKVLAFAISAMVTGLAGGLFAHDATGGLQVRPEAFRLDKSVDILVMIIFGGLGSITGAVLGAVFVGVSLELLRELPNLMGRGDVSPLARALRDNAGNLRLIVYAFLLVALMLVRPQGLLGTRELTAAGLRRLWPFKRSPTAKGGGPPPPSQEQGPAA